MTTRKKPDKAKETFTNGYNCAQSILRTFGPELGLSETLATKAGTGFGAGISYRGEMCGAVCGALFILGLHFGPKESSDETAKDRTYYYINKFIKEFENNNGSLLCRQLLNADISTEEGLEHARKDELFDKVCPLMVKSSAEILEHLLTQKNKP